MINGIQQVDRTTVTMGFSFNVKEYMINQYWQKNNGSYVMHLPKSSVRRALTSALYNESTIGVNKFEAVLEHTSDIYS